MFFLMAAVDILGIIAIVPVLTKAYTRKYQEFGVEKSESQRENN